MDPLNILCSPGWSSKNDEIGVVMVRLAQREEPLGGLLTAKDPLAVIAALVTHLRVDWPSAAEAEVGDLTAAAKGSEEAGLESLFLGGMVIHLHLHLHWRPLCCQVKVQVHALCSTPQTNSAAAASSGCAKR